MPSLSPRGPRLRLAVFTMILGLVPATLHSNAFAQYMYLDSDGDGVHTETDVVNPTGSTTIDVYLITDQGADGFPDLCADYEQNALTINSYTVVLRAVGGGVTWGVPINQMPQFGFNLGYFFGDTELIYGKAGTILEPGAYRLMSVTATVASGMPEIQIVATAQTVDPRLGFTQFGSRCLGERGANTMRLGEDWFDVSGLPVGTVTPSNSGPTLAALQDMSVPSGEPTGQTVAATDPDGQILKISLVSAPNYVSLTTMSQERGSATGRINLSPTRADIGSSSATVSASDGERSTPGTFAITVVDGPDHPARLAPIGNLTVTCGRVLAEPIRARDPDGEVLTFTKLSGPAFLTVTTLAGGSAAAHGLIHIAPVLCDAGAHEAVIAVGNGALFDQAAMQVDVELPLTILGELERQFAVASAPVMEVAASDFNRDGKVDLAVLAGHDGVITVLLGDGAGQFRSHTNISDLGFALRIRSGDWNQDGLTDLGTIDFSSPGRLVLLEGQGDGSFAPMHVFPTGGSPQDFTTADLNNDGLLDIVVANSTSSFVNVYMAMGGGAFTAHTVPTAQTSFCVVASDVNGDGILDLAVGTFAQRTVSIHFGVGDGTFQDAIEFPVPADPYMISSADLNEDGASDLVIADFDGAILNLMGNGKGEFVPGAPISGFGTSPTASLADVNGDGHMDIAVVGPESEGVTALFGDGSGAFPTRAQIAPSRGDRVTLADVNDDAIPDLVLPGTGFAPTVKIRLNTIGAGTAVEARAFLKDSNRPRPGAAGNNPFCARVEPVNGSYVNSDVNYSSLTLKSDGTGSVSSIAATQPKNVAEGDTDGNNVAEIPACFAGADVARLFDDVSSRKTLHVSLEGALLDGRRFCSGFDMTVVGTGGPLAATVTPNPLNPAGVLAFRTSRDGYVRVRMFDLNGRLVRVLADVPLAVAGDQEIRIDGRGARGETLATGAYFYVVETPEGKTRGRIMILK